MRKTKIFGVSNQDTGVYWYRVVQPLESLGRQRAANIHHLPFYGQHARHLTGPEFREYFAKEGKWADVVVTTTASDREYLALILAMKDTYNFKLVVDLDDDILSTHTEPNSPAYRAYQNKEARFAEYAQFCLANADLVTVSTDYLKRKYEPINKNIVVIKNAVNPKLFPKQKPDDVTIGYSGSGSHQKDWEMIEPTLLGLKDSHDVKLKVLGPMMTKNVDAQLEWAEMLLYPQALSDMRFSIGVAPLKDSLMSRGKSNLRWLEYSALGIPTVASDVVAFRDDENVIRVSEPEEWQEELTKLVEDKKYRTELGKKAHNEVKANYDPRTWSRKLYDAISQL